MATKTSRKHSLADAVLIPLDWTEERSGLVGYTKWFLFRKVPHDISWAQTLGAASLTAFIVQATTGVFLAMYYKPDPSQRVLPRSRTSRRSSRSAGSCAACTSGARASSSS